MVQQRSGIGPLKLHVRQNLFRRNRSNIMHMLHREELIFPEGKDSEWQLQERS